MDNEDTVFVECSDGVASREPSVEVLPEGSGNGEVKVELDMSGEREDIVQVHNRIFNKLIKPEWVILEKIHILTIEEISAFQSRGVGGGGCCIFIYSCSA